MSKGGQMSNRLFNTQTANTREASSKKIGSFGRGQNEIPKPVMAGAVTTKGIAPTSMGKESVEHHLQFLKDQLLVLLKEWALLKKVEDTLGFKWHTLEENMQYLFLIVVDYNFPTQKW
jgi:hypothetical protein